MDVARAYCCASMATLVVMAIADRETQSEPSPAGTGGNEIEVSVVIPCLNEAETIETCIEKAKRSFERAGVAGEVVVADNGSSDGSQKLAEDAGARVINESRKGYGSAYLAGFAAARGGYIIMGDGDDTYDFSQLERFLSPLKDGADMVMGTRLKGNIEKNAMPWLHQYLGNPLFTKMVRALFKAPVSDTYCGMRGIQKGAYQSLGMGRPGMEFAIEMVIKATRKKLKITEVPIAYTGRAAPSKLNTWRDGWRTLKFILGSYFRRDGSASG